METMQPSSAKLILWSVLSIVSAIICLGVFPPLFGGLAILFGYLARRQNPTVGIILMIIGAVALIVGFVLGFQWGMENIRF